MHAAWSDLKLPKGAVVNRSSASELEAKVPFLSSAAKKHKRYALADAEALIEKYMELLEREHGWVAVESEDSFEFPAWHLAKAGDKRTLFVSVEPARAALALMLVWNTDE